MMIGKMVGFVLDVMKYICVGLLFGDICCDVLFVFVCLIVISCDMVFVVVFDVVLVVGFLEC